MLLSSETILYGLPIDMDVGDFLIALGFTDPYIVYLETLPKANVFDVVVLDETDFTQRKNMLYVSGLRAFLGSRFAVTLKPWDFEVLKEFRWC